MSACEFISFTIKRFQKY